MTIAKGGRTITLAPDDHEFLKDTAAHMDRTLTAQLHVIIAEWAASRQQEAK